LPAGFSTGTYGDRLYADAGQAPGFVLQIGTHPQLSSVVEGELKRALVSDVHGDDGPAKQIQYGTEARSGARVKFMPIAVAVGELSQIAASTSGLVCAGCEFGRCDRSASPSSPSSRYERTQRCTACRDTPNRSATSVTGTPA
jgi:hypothetical protein